MMKELPNTVCIFHWGDFVYHWIIVQWTEAHTLACLQH